MDPGQLIAAADGMLLAQDIEKYLLTVAIASSLQRICYTASGTFSPLITKLPPPATCRRLQEPNVTIACNNCGVEIYRFGAVFYRK